MKNWPEYATFCGIHEYDHLLNDFTISAFKQREVSALSGFRVGKICFRIDISAVWLQIKAQEFLTEANRLLETKQFDGEDLFNLRLLREELNLFVEGSKYQGWVIEEIFRVSGSQRPRFHAGIWCACATTKASTCRWTSCWTGWSSRRRKTSRSYSYASLLFPPEYELRHCTNSAWNLLLNDLFVGNPL